jgi:hypothetical protein
LSFQGQAFKNSVPLLRNVSTFNPIHMMFALDNTQNRYFKRVLLYDEMRRQAFADMARHGETAFKAQGAITHMLELDPKKRLEQMIQDPETVIRHAEAVDNVLGNWVRYTARERRTLKRYVMFYGFLRYSLRLTFYTMPVKHPVTMSIIAKLTQLHNQEVSDLLGGPDTPWAFSRIYSGVRYNKRKGKFEFKDPAVRAGRKPAQSVDLARLNPASNPAIDIANEGPKALLSFTSPAVQIALDQAYGVNSFTGQRFKVGGVAEGGHEPAAVLRRPRKDHPQPGAVARRPVPDGATVAAPRETDRRQPAVGPAADPVQDPRQARAATATGRRAEPPAAGARQVERLPAEHPAAPARPVPPTARQHGVERAGVQEEKEGRLVIQGEPILTQRRRRVERQLLVGVSRKRTPPSTGNLETDGPLARRPLGTPHIRLPRRRHLGAPPTRHQRRRHRTRRVDRDHRTHRRRRRIPALTRATTDPSQGPLLTDHRA